MEGMKGKAICRSLLLLQLMRCQSLWLRGLVLRTSPEVELTGKRK